MKFMDAYENTTALNEMDFRKMVEDTNNSPIVIKQRSLSRFDIVAPLSNALCAETVFETMTFKGHWKEIEMQKCIFKDCIFEQVTGSSISFIGSTFIDCIFLNCRIPRTDFTKCNFEKLKITDSDLNRANFSLSNIADIDVHNCKINNTLLEDTEKKKEEQRRYRSERDNGSRAGRGLSSALRYSEGLDQWFSPFLTLRPFNILSQVVVTPNHKIISLLLHNCNFASYES